MDNRLIHGNCLDELKHIEANTVDLIYLDPPFYTQRKHISRTRDNSKTYEFSDQWNSLSEYLTTIKNCLVEFRRILKETGNLFFHCDRRASHHIRLLLDDVFGARNFQSEIIWYYKRWSNAKKGLLNSHQNIYFYSKAKAFKFNAIYTDYSPTTNVDQILQKRARDKHNKSTYARDENGDVIIDGEKKGVPLADVWEIPFLNPKAKERAGYPTQKPILLLEKIILLATEENDLVLDPFCGSGTTLVAAKLLNREYIGIDISEEAIQLSEKRLGELIKTDSRLLEKGKEYYGDKPERELSLLRSLNAIPVYRNSGIDGFLKNTPNGKPVPIRIQKDGEALDTAKSKLIGAAKSKSCEYLILVRTSFVEQGSLDFQESSQQNMLIIDSHDLVIRRALEQSNIGP